jgi:phosphoglycerol transferase MdoB-like AlkP superfamily enzyme
MMNMDNLLWLACTLAEAAVIGLLLYRRVWRTLPFFCVYIVWGLLSSVGAYAVLHFYPASYFTAYLSGTAVDSTLEICVLIELAWSVLRPLRASLPRRALAVVAGLVVALGAAIWPFAVIPGFSNLPAEWHLLMHLQQTTSILRILFFLALAAGSQVLSIGWRNRELQVATGLGFYSFVSIAVAMLHTHASMGSQYNHLDEIEVASYFFSLLYWGFSFAQQEAERQEFTPQMQNFLLAMAGTARSTRLAMIDSSSSKGRRREE